MRAAADELLAIADEAVRVRGVFWLVLAGGRTPRALYERLAEVGRRRGGAVASRWQVWFGDERMVPPDHPDSNLRMAREAWLAHVPLPATQVHAIPTEPPDPIAAAAAYEATIRRVTGAKPPGIPVFDLVLLGMGEDGHTASLFPGSLLLEERVRLAAAVRKAPKPPPDRVTLTLPLLWAARHVRFLVTGADKAAVLARVLAGGRAARALPAACVARGASDVAWYVDAAAAGPRKPERSRGSAIAGDGIQEDAHRGGAVVGPRDPRDGERSRERGAEADLEQQMARRLGVHAPAQPRPGDGAREELAEARVRAPHQRRHPRVRVRGRRAVEHAELVFALGQERLEPLPQGVQAGRDAVDVRDRVGEPIQDPVPGSCEHGLEQRLLRRKVPVENGFGHPGGARELARGRPVRPPDGEERQGRLRGCLRGARPRGGAGEGSCGCGPGA